MLRICWLTCLLSLAVSTQTVLGQTASSSGRDANSEFELRIVESCPGSDNVRETWMQHLVDLLRTMHHPYPCTQMSTECTRQPCPAKGVEIEEITPISWPWDLQFVPASTSQSSPTPAADEDDDSDEECPCPDCCEETTTSPEECECEWLRQVRGCMKSWFRCWQCGSCQMSQAARTVCGAVDGAAMGAAIGSGEAPACPGQQCPLARSAEWLLRAPRFVASPNFPLPREMRTIVIRTRSAGSGNETAKQCPCIQAMTFCTGGNPMAVVSWLLSACKPCCETAGCAKTDKAGCCPMACAKNTGPNCAVFVFRVSSAGWPTVAVRTGKICCCEPEGATGCPFAKMMDVNGVPNCARATAGKPGCCGNCNCKSCGKGNSAGEAFEGIWSAYAEAVSRMMAEQAAVLAPRTKLGPGMVCPQQPMPPLSHWLPPICPPPPWAAGPVPQGPFGPYPPPPCQPGQFAAFAPTPPWMGCGSPVVGWPVHAPAVHCPAGGAVQPQAFLQLVPMAETRTTAQPASLPQPAACQEECTIVAKDGVVCVTAGGMKAFCSSVTCSASRDHIVLVGNVRLECKKGNETTRIEAPRVVVDLSEGTFTIESATPAAPANAPAAVIPPGVNMPYSN